MIRPKLYSGSTGINNKIAPHRLPFGKGGVSALETADNVLIDRTGEVISRRGTSALVSGVFHSGWSFDGGFYCIEDRGTDSALLMYTENPDGSISLHGIRDKMTRGAKCSFLDLAGKTFYMNGYERGVISSGVSSEWQEQDWTGPETTTPMGSMPIGSHLDILSGHMIVAKGDELWHSEHGLLNLVDELKNVVRFESDITMVFAVQSGLYVSDEKSIWFVSGLNPNEWLAKKVTNYKATGRNQTLVDPILMGFENPSLSALIATEQGQVIGFPDGTIFNLINKSVSLPKHCSTGAIMVVDETTILQG